MVESSSSTSPLIWASSPAAVCSSCASDIVDADARASLFEVLSFLFYLFVISQLLLLLLLMLICLS